MSEKIHIEMTNEEYDMLLEIQDVLGHETLDETINMILKEFIESEERKEKERKEAEMTFEEVCALKDKMEDAHNEAKASINRRHQEYMKESSGREKAFNEMRRKGKKI